MNTSTARSFKLPVLLFVPLYPADARYRTGGVQVQPLSADDSLHNNTLLFFENADITFEEALTLGIYARTIRDILQFDSCPYMVFEKSHSIGCHCRSEVRA